MPIAPFRPPPVRRDIESRRARLAVLAAIMGIAAALLAYAISPSVRHAVRKAAGSVRHAVGKVFTDSDRRASPALPTTVLVGPAVTLRALHGHPAVVTFWSSACAVCARDARAVERFAAVPPGRGRIVGVALDEPTASARRFVVRHHWTFTNLLDAHGAVGRLYGIKSTRDLPTTYVLDSSGHIFRTLPGALTEARLTSQLAAAGK